MSALANCELPPQNFILPLLSSQKAAWCETQESFGELVGCGLLCMPIVHDLEPIPNLAIQQLFMNPHFLSPPSAFYKMKLTPNSRGRPENQLWAVSIRVVQGIRKEL